MKKQKMIMAMALFAALVLSACGSQPPPTNEQPAQDDNLIYTQAVETAQAQQEQTEAWKPQPSPTFVPSPTSMLLATNTPLVFDQVTPTLPQLPTIVVPPTYTPPPQGGNSGTSGWVDGRPCLRADLLNEKIHDGRIFPPEVTFKKFWRLGNSGNCTWTKEFSVVFVRGTSMGKYQSYTLEEFNVGDEGIPNGGYIDIKIRMTTPASEGSYRGVYMLMDQDGNLFGIGMFGDEVFWVDIVVRKP